jgi:16S rRNA (guanine527-N7)-methyltransferase
MTPGQADELFRRNGLEIPVERIGALLEYESLLLEWNTKINLVSRRDTKDFFIRHVVGSVSFLFTHRFSPNTRLLDVGTGGGLPGIPLAILHPDVGVTMIDSIQKKVRAVSHIIDALALPNAVVRCSRVEDFQAAGIPDGRDPGGTKQGFEYIVARGVSTASQIVRWCGPLLRSGRGTCDGAAKHPAHRELIPVGSYILLKGGDLTGELSSLGEVVDRASVTVRSLEVEGSGDLLTEKKVIIITA